MKCKIVYLRQRSGFKTSLHSDTLWNALCWSIRLVYGNEQLEQLLETYTDSEQQPAFCISSAFPYQIVEGQRVPYFPSPMKVINSIAPTGDFVSKRNQYRALKKQKKRSLMSQENFEVAIGAKSDSNQLGKGYTAPKVETLAVTKNRISRITGSTLTIKKAGQLFHTDEQYVVATEETETGLFFLVKTNKDEHLNLLKGALRFLEHIGIGGNRTNGKGSFSIEVEDFELAEPDDFNSVTTLSLYRPTTAELALWKPDKLQREDLFRYSYKIVTRQGKSGFLHQKYEEKEPLNFFQEGSIFPINATTWQDFFGQNVPYHNPSGNYTAQHYGHAFVVKMKI